MKTFPIWGKKPWIKWGSIPDQTFYKLPLDEGFSLGVTPNQGQIILDIDNKPNQTNGWDSIPDKLVEKFKKEHFIYNTNSGAHVWFWYTGDKKLLGRTTKYGLDLRIPAQNGHCGNYVKWYLPNDPREYMHLVKETDEEINNFIEQYFA